MNPTSCTANIAVRVDAIADERPDQAAVVSLGSNPGQVTYRQLAEASSRCADGLRTAGIEAGMRVLVLIRPGPQFSTTIFGLLKLGALPVLVDPGMGLKGFLACVRQVRPQALIGVPAAQVVYHLFGDAFRSVRIAITAGRRWLWGGANLEQVIARGDASFEPVELTAQTPAAILFTSGSTGPAKGVVYAHGMLDAQVRSIQSHYGLEPGEIELATFPLFALFCPLMGMTCVLPDMDFSRPGQVNPARVVEAIRTHGATNAFGSPALWRRVAAYCGEARVRLPSLRRVLIAGAPVDWRIIEAVKACLADHAEVYTPYGATEALPVSSISGTEVLDHCRMQTRTGAGICVGRPVADREVRIIRVSDEPLPLWSDTNDCPAGAVGEIVVSGAVVTRRYFEQDDATTRSKIADGDRLWHRMGDVGYLDDHGRLWYCGRKSHRVETADGPLYSECCEGVFDEHPDVFRSALVGIGPVGRQEPVVVVEPSARRLPRGERRAQWITELRALAGAHPSTASIRRFCFHRRFPVDIRHNAKINREQLARWVRGQVR